MGDRGRKTSSRAIAVVQAWDGKGLNKDSKCGPGRKGADLKYIKRHQKWPLFSINTWL